MDTLISQSLMKMVLPNDACPKAIKYRHIDGLPSTDSELMLRGRFFEYNLIGECRGGEIPVMPTLKNGGMSQGHKDVLETIDYARLICRAVKINIEDAEKQVYIVAGELDGHIDMISNDIMKPDRKAIYDFKYTETKYDDRWNGWGDFGNKVNEQIQARHYIRLYYDKYGEYLPYYFLVFGKSLWCRIIKVEVTYDTMSIHDSMISAFKIKYKEMQENGWIAKPIYAKCNECAYFGICEDKAISPEIEVYKV